MHIVLAFTLLHDRHLSNTWHQGPSRAEIFHLYSGTAWFKSRLSNPALLSEQDALWASAAVLGAITFAGIEASTLEEAWPLSPPSDIDMDWLRLSDGKKAVRNLAEEKGVNSIFQGLAPESWLTASPDISVLSAFSPLFAELFDLDATSTFENNPYHAPASILAQLQAIPCGEHTIIQFMSYISHVRSDHKILLQQKDPRAMLLLAYWYALICHYQCWWIRRRSLLEGQAICIYLERYHSEDRRIRELIQFPKKNFREALRIKTRETTRV